MATTVQVTLNKTEKRPLARTMKQLYTIALGYAQSARQRASAQAAAPLVRPNPIFSVRSNTIGVSRKNDCG